MKNADIARQIINSITIERLSVNPVGKSSCLWRADITFMVSKILWSRNTCILFVAVSGERVK